MKQSDRVHEVHEAGRVYRWTTMAIVAGAMTLGLGACGFPKTVDGPPPAITAQRAEEEARTRPGTSLASLNRGRDLFAAKCNGCHGYPDIASVPDERWPEIMKRMGKKASLEGAQTEEVLGFVRAAKAP